MIDWSQLTKDADDAILAITKRATALRPELDHCRLMMDLSACHVSGCRLNLPAMVLSDDYNLLHDVYGITNHIDRNTGKLLRCFMPKFAAI